MDLVLKLVNFHDRLARFIFILFQVADIHMYRSCLLFFSNLHSAHLLIGFCVSHFCNT